MTRIPPIRDHHICLNNAPTASVSLLRRQLTTLLTLTAHKAMLSELQANPGPTEFHMSAFLVVGKRFHNTGGPVCAKNIYFSPISNLGPMNLPVAYETFVWGYGATEGVEKKIAKDTWN